MDNVCARCIGDEDLKAWIRDRKGRRGCDFCNGYTAPTAPLSELCEYIEACLSDYYGQAVDQLPWNSREGGYQGCTWTTDELVFDECQLDLPRDISGRLQQAIYFCLSDDLWCDYDWLRLDEDEAMKSAWSHFCTTVKHERRFFFHNKGADPEDLDSYSALGILSAIAHLAELLGLVRTQSAGLRLYRARPGFKQRSPSAKDFGPPPRNVCQTNRMNPAGVPMFYGALDPKTAVREVREEEARVGYFQVARPLLILDLTKIPPVPGVFSSKDRRTRLYLSFLHHFALDIMQPVARDDRVHTEYVPSQVVTEFLREHSFNAGQLDGVMYGSVVSPGKRNIVLFIEDLEPKDSPYGLSPPLPLRFLRAKTVKLPTGSSAPH